MMMQSISHRYLSALVMTALAIASLATGSGCAVASARAAAGSADATDYEWSIDLDCALCHEAEADSLASADSERAGAAARNGEEAVSDEAAGPALSSFSVAHAALDLACQECHEDTPELAKAHKRLNSGKTATRLKKSAVSSDLCLTCHDRELLEEATEGSTLITDAAGTSVNPHALPESEPHEAIACTSCHTIHGAEPADQTALEVCASCHHAGVFECGTCH